MTQQDILKINIPEKNGYSYDIIIGENLVGNLDCYLKKYTLAKKYLFVTNETIWNLYRESIKLKNAKFVILKDGEEYKNFETLKHIIDEAVEYRLERNDCMIAFGGGVIGDITGFAAATYLRGIDFIQIPTTLLAQVDSSVGGKVAINHEKGKNLIGAFYQPKLVLSDINLLRSLDQRQLKTGLGEVIKYAFIEKSCGCPLNYRLFDYLHANKDNIFRLDTKTLIQLINICCTLKASVVEKDETEKGLRAILNFGHTFAHAIESLTHYTIYTHGEAVAIGMKMAFKLAKELKMIDEDYQNAGNELIDKYSLVGNIPDFDSEKFVDAMILDKKTNAAIPRFILPDADFCVKMTTDIDLKLIKKSLKV